MSNSLNVAERFARRNMVRKATAAIYVVTAGVYLIWRTTTFNHDAPVLSGLYYAADIIAVLLGLMVIFVSWTYRHRTPRPAQSGLSVDVFVPTYQEPIDVIRQTMQAAVAIDYPHTTWLLDDGNRSEVRALAQELGCRYLAREKNINAKAGNLNNGLRNSSADFVAIFDADHIPLPHALDAMLGFFTEPNLSMVQAPQDYYNTNAFQYMSAKHSGALWHDQSFFYNIALPCRDSWNAITCVGTSVIFRRSALDLIGGIAEETVTEDIHTAVRLAKKGFEAVYLNEPVAYGIGATDLRDFYKTRHRWAHGNIHTLRLENVLFCKGLTWKQRLCYLEMGLIYLEGWQQLILFTVPVFSLFLGIPAFEITVFNVVVLLLYPVFAYMLLQEMGCGFARFWANEILSLARFPVHILAWAALVKKKMAWRSSAKVLRGEISLPLIAPQLAVLLISLAAIIFGAWRLAGDFQSGPILQALLAILPTWLGGTGMGITAIDWGAPLPKGYTVELVVVAGLFALMNALRAGLLIGKAYLNARDSKADFAFKIPLPIELTGTKAQLRGMVDEISTSRLRFRLNRPLPMAINQVLHATIYLPSGPLHTNLNAHALTHGSVTRSGEVEGALIDAEFDWISQDDRDQLARSLYSVDWHREFLHRNAYFLTPLEVLKKLMVWRQSKSRERVHWSGVLYRQAGGGDSKPSLAILASPGTDNGSRLLMAFDDLDTGAQIDVEDFASSREAWARSYRVIDTVPMQTIARRGLDGTEFHKHTVEPLEQTETLSDQNMQLPAAAD